MIGFVNPHKLSRLSCLEGASSLRISLTSSILGISSPAPDTFLCTSVVGILPTSTSSVKLSSALPNITLEFNRLVVEDLRLSLREEKSCNTSTVDEFLLSSSNVPKLLAYPLLSLLGLTTLGAFDFKISRRVGNPSGSSRNKALSFLTSMISRSEMSSGLDGILLESSWSLRDPSVVNSSDGNLMVTFPSKSANLSLVWSLSMSGDFFDIGSLVCCCSGERKDLLKMLRDSRFVDGCCNLTDDSLDDRIGFASNLRTEGCWSAEALEGNGKTRFSLSRGMSRVASLEVGAAIVNDFGMEPGDSSSIAVCLKIKEKLKLKIYREGIHFHFLFFLLLFQYFSPCTYNFIILFIKLLIFSFLGKNLYIIKIS